MRILPEPLAFQWDDGNIDKNFDKHRVTVREAEEMFATEPFLTLEDGKHSSSLEKRFQGLGKTKTGRRLFVVFTIRDKRIRIISIRDMKKKERMSYEHVEASA
jgi:uncharacterized protein